MSKWRNWTDQLPQSFDPWEDIRLKREWYQTHIPLLNEYANLFFAAMRAKGFQIAITLDPSQTYQDVGMGVMGWSMEGKAEKDGFARYFNIGPMTPRDFTPEEYANYIEREYNFERSLAIQGANTLGVITNEALYQSTQSQYSKPDLAFTVPVPQWASPAQTPTTVPSGATIQPIQAPNTPDAGTQMTPLPDDPVLRTFDEWNYLYRQETGRIPPAPETVGYTKPRETKISKTEWESYVFSGGSGESSGSGGSGGSGGSTPTVVTHKPKTEMYSLLEGILVLIGILPKTVWS